MTIQTLGLAVDAALASFDSAVAAYIAAMDQANHDRDPQTWRNPHPLHSRGREKLLAAVASKVDLAKVLGVMPRNPGTTLAQLHQNDGGN